MQFTIAGNPITKKNSSRIVNVGRYHKILPSKQYEQYEKDCFPYVREYRNMRIDWPVNIKMVYYMKTRHRVDLPNLINGTLDMLVHYGVLADDNRNIVYSTDGSRVLYDKENPRTEITIEPINEDMEWWGKKEVRQKRTMESTQTQC